MIREENFALTKNLQHAIKKQITRNTNKENLNWFQICWMRFCRSAPYTILYKMSVEDTEFKTLHLSPTCPRRPSKFKKIALVPLYHDIRPIIYEKYKDKKQLLSYIPPMHHEYFKTQPHEEHK